MTLFHFKPQWQIVNQIAAATTDFRYDPMFFHADYEFVMSNVEAGSETQRLAEALFAVTDGKGVLDTRVHMLKPGWCPAIGGWHCDEVFRSGGQDSQPELGMPRRGDMATGYFGICPTLFDNEERDLDILDVPTPIWGRVSAAMERTRGSPTILMPGQIAHFDSGDLHTASQSSGAGWRVWGRVIAGIPEMPAFNEIRRQVQAYVDLSAGW